MTDERLCRVALGFVPGMNAGVLRVMEERGVGCRDFFSMPMEELSAALGANRRDSFPTVIREEAMFRARAESEFNSRHGIRALSWWDDDYPARLREIPDAPVNLYCLGDCDLNGEHFISVVGTRRCTPYGSSYCHSLVEDLSAYFPDLTVVSGLAYGIDAAAHSAAIEKGVATVAVVAHGLHMIYPAAHRDLARRIIRSGGALLSEYPRGEAPYRARFLERNRIVAALSDVTVVVESEIKGGAMSTAHMAMEYDREVVALPGRVTDQASSGCNHLIRTNRASMAGTAADLLTQVGWTPLDLKLKPVQRNLFPELDGDAREIYDALRGSGGELTPDEMHRVTSIPMPRLMAQLSELEFDGVIARHPGNRFSLI